MNAFQILDKDNNPIPINILDESAAKFWNQPVHPKWYASPSDISTNWKDAIGWYIANPGDYTSGWNNVKISLITTTMQSVAYEILLGKIEDKSIKSIIKRHQSYFDLIDYWADLGYQPKQIK